MRIPLAVPPLALAALFGCSALFAPAPVRADLELTPVISSGLSNPLFVTNAGDGSRRLFIVERDGNVRVLQPGASTATLFLDLQRRVASGGERGLLGLAFHPQYARNGRFFVYYTRAGDGDVVIAEYGVSRNPNVADAAETVLLTIDHSANANHNGGMLAFGPDGYLYAGVGDGGSANDPPDNAQNTGVLLGKILRLDVDRPEGGRPYSAPPDNPFAGGGGRAEIFAFGWRNPWRFSFDRATGQLWVADVGQGAREEVDTPIENGGNYGWRVFEGSGCTGNDPGQCVPSNYLFPIFDYTHQGGRCSITGGYVYRGAQGALPEGTYVYGDYCSGEIFGWDGATQSILRDTSFAISSFGEDEDGELYVVDLNGSVSRIGGGAPTPGGGTPGGAVTCTFSITPARAVVGRGGGDGAVQVRAEAGCDWNATSNVAWVTIVEGDTGNGDGTVRYSVDLSSGRPRRRVAKLAIAGKTFTLVQR
jgi:glucose/arabinose dehydrogenase